MTDALSDDRPKDLAAILAEPVKTQMMPDMHPLAAVAWKYHDAHPDRCIHNPPLADGPMAGLPDRRITGRYDLDNTEFLEHMYIMATGDAIELDVILRVLGGPLVERLLADSSLSLPIGGGSGKSYERHQESVKSYGPEIVDAIARHYGRDAPKGRLTMRHIANKHVKDERSRLGRDLTLEEELAVRLDMTPDFISYALTGGAAEAVLSTLDLYGTGTDALTGAMTAAYLAPVDEAVALALRMADGPKPLMPWAQDPARSTGPSTQAPAPQPQHASSISPTAVPSPGDQSIFVDPAIMQTAGPQQPTPPPQTAIPTAVPATPPAQPAYQPPSQATGQTPAQPMPGDATQIIKLPMSPAKKRKLLAGAGAAAIAGTITFIGLMAGRGTGSDATHASLDAGIRDAYDAVHGYDAGTPDAMPSITVDIDYIRDLGLVGKPTAEIMGRVDRYTAESKLDLAVGLLETLYSRGLQDVSRDTLAARLCDIYPRYQAKLADDLRTSPDEYKQWIQNDIERIGRNKDTLCR